jgi:LysR family transcriptional regulator, hydrogen peroxide-inducible genes activator
LNLRDLKYLVAIADVNSFGRAAAKCFVSQPTLSTQIRKLEEELGVTVFERTNRSVRLTEAGERIVEAARRISAEVDLIRAIAESTHDPLAGTFRLGAFPTLAGYLFPMIVPPIAQSLPKLKLLLIEEKTDVLVERLKAGQCDVALLALPINDPSLLAMTLFEDPFLLAVPEGHPLASRLRVNPADLADMKLLLLDEGHCLRDQALDVCYRHGGHEEPDFRATSLETLRMMVKAGTGITLMPKIAAGDDDTGIRYVPFSDPPPRRLIGLVWRKTTARSRAIQAIAEIVAAARPGKALSSENG